MDGYQMINCQELHFDPVLQKRRIERITPVLGKMVIQRLLCFALYLLGVNRCLLGEKLSLSPGSVRTIIRSLQNGGLPALEDRRRRVSQFLPNAIKDDKSSKLIVEHDSRDITISKKDFVIKVPASNPLQARTMLLTLLDNGLLDRSTVGQVIGITSQQVSNLARSLRSEDVTGLIDKRQGQKIDYKVTPEVKSELIQQFVVNIVMQKQTSGKVISEELKNRCDLTISQRTVRYYFVSLGLNKIRKTLPKLLPIIKKTLRFPKGDSMV